MRSRHEGDADNLTSIPDILPKLTNAAFVDILKETGTYHISCEREADVHIAELACFLNSPLVSNDSDFYIFRPPSQNYNYQYIPLNTLGQHPIRSSKQICQTCPSGCYVLPCSMFHPQASLLGRIHPPLLPLLAALIGNDFIEAVRVPNTVDLLIQNPSRSGLSYTGKRIDAVIRWLISFGSDVIKPLEQILSQYREVELKPTTQQMIEITLDYMVYPLSTGRELASVLKLTPTTGSLPDLKTCSDTLHQPLSSSTTHQPRSDLHRCVSAVVNALTNKGSEKTDRFSNTTRPEENLVLRWPERLIRRLHQVELPTGIMDTLYVTGGSVQRILFEDVFEQHASIYSVINPLRRVFYNLLVSLEFDRDCAHKLCGLCDDRELMVVEHRRQADQMCPFIFSVSPRTSIKPTLSSPFSNGNIIQFFCDHFNLHLDRPPGLSSDLRTIQVVLTLWFRLSSYSLPENRSSGACSPVALAFVACALTTHAYLGPCLKQYKPSVDRATSQLCESFTVLANSVKQGCSNLRYSIQLVHQINELQLLMLELKHLWCVLDSLSRQDPNRRAPFTSDDGFRNVDDDQSTILSFWPNWMLFPSGRLFYWLALTLDQMRPEIRMEIVLHTWLPRLYEAGSSAAVGAAFDLKVLKERVILLFDSIIR